MESSVDIVDCLGKFTKPLYFTAGICGIEYLEGISPWDSGAVCNFALVSDVPFIRKGEC